MLTCSQSALLYQTCFKSTIRCVTTILVQDVSAVSDNAAVLQQRVTKGTNVFLSTLAEPGEAQFLTVLKPCGILLPHVHQRANEFYSVIFGMLLYPCRSMLT